LRAHLAAVLICAGIGSAASLPNPDLAPAAWHAAHGRATEDRAVTHEAQRSERLEAANGADAVAISASVTLTLGHWYELSGYLHTEGVEVRDIGRSPIAVGAALSMSSMPFDVHSESLGGTRPWTPVHLRFQATSARDEVVLSLGRYGTASGKAWFSGVHLAEATPEGAAPSPASVRTFGPAYRYPQHGWIYLHIEGAPYERGFQHGYLMADEIERYIARCAALLDAKTPEHIWEWARTQSDALFLRRFDEEIRLEMSGIADGAAAHGAKWRGRKIDLRDIVAINTLTELDLLQSAMPMTPTGLESIQLNPPAYFEKKRDVAVTERCSAFAATGPATRDGKMMIAHLTMWPMTLSEQTNIMLDVQPSAGHRVLMQSYPGGIQSGTDWYQNDAGMVLTETTIRQSPFNIDGLPVAFRARKAIQYGDSIDKVVEYLGTKNNGMYTNEWIIADARTNEVAMYELGTYKTKLYRSSKQEWFGNTPGFFWGDNNAKDLSVRLEYAPDPKGEPAHLPYVPSDRDLKWMELYRQYEGRIDADFAFTALRTAPLVSSTTVDAKIASGDMAKNMMVWATFGKPNEREWVPTAKHQEEYPMDEGIYPGGYSLFSARPSPALASIVHENEQTRAAKRDAGKETETGSRKKFDRDLLWKGWILPARPEDDWLTAGSAVYYRALPAAHFDREVEAWRAQFRAASLSAPNAAERYRMDASKGALLIDALRGEMGDDAFFTFMKKFFAENTTKTVRASVFIRASGLAHEALFTRWLGSGGIPDDRGGPVYVISELRPAAARLAHVVLVYGTQAEAGANRYAAERIQSALTDMFESQPAIYKDFEATPDLLREHDVVFIGRPETNGALAAWQSAIRLAWEGTSFHLENADHGAGDDGLIFAAANPLDAKRMVLVVAGNSPIETVRLASQPFGPSQYAIYSRSREATSGFLK
jgi:hypothetical protein